MVKTTKVWFTGMDKKGAQTSPLFRLIKDEMKLTLDPDCDFLFVDYKDYVYAKSYLKHDGVRIFYSTENIFPDYTLVDYALCPNYLPNSDRFLWLPFYWWDDNCWNLVKGRTIDDWASRRNFCCFIVSNNNAEPMRTQPKRSMREHMFAELEKYRRVDSPGRFRNNCPPIPVDQNAGMDYYSAKIEFMRNYRFALVCENSSSPGYATEKIVHSFLAGCIPIYWGDPKITEQFEDGSFIWVRNEQDVERAVKEIIFVDQDENHFKNYFKFNQVYKKLFQEICTPDYVKNFLLSILRQDPKEAIRRSQYYLSSTYESRMATRQLEISSTDQITFVPSKLKMTDFTGHANNVIASVQDNLLNVRLVEEWKGYFVSVPGRFKSPPDLTTNDRSRIPESAVEVTIRLNYCTDIPILITPFFIQYDDEKEIRTDFMDFQSSAEGVIDANFPVMSETRSYKLAIRVIRNDRTATTFDFKISAIDLSFKCVKNKSV